MSRTRTGRISFFCTDTEFVSMGLEELLPHRKYAVEAQTKVTDLFGRGTEELPSKLRAFLLKYFQKTFQDIPGARLFFHPDHSPIDDANLIEIVDVMENSGKNRLDLDAGRRCAHEMQIRYSFRAQDHARTIAQGMCDVLVDIDILECMHKEGVDCTMEQVHACTTEQLWTMQGGFECLFCKDKVLNWHRCASCGVRTCVGCVVFRDLAFNTKMCGNCGNCM